MTKKTSQFGNARYRFSFIEPGVFIFIISIFYQVMGACVTQLNIFFKIWIVFKVFVKTYNCMYSF